MRKANANKPLMNASRPTHDVKTRDARILWDKSDGNLLTDQVASGVKVARFSFGHLNGTTGTILVYDNRKAQSTELLRLKIGTTQDGADLFVGARKFL